jgi:hypothetical protein
VENTPTRGKLCPKINRVYIKIMQTLSSGDTSAYKYGVSPKIKREGAVKLGIH